MKIKAVYVGQYHDLSQAYTVCKQNNSRMKQDLEKLPSKIKALNAKAGQRNKLKADYGNWFVMHINKWAYGVCTNSEYPQRHAYGLIDKIRQFTQKQQNPSNGKFTKQLKKIIEQNAQKYEDLTKIDKVHKAQAQVNLLEQDLHTGIKKLMNNQQNLQQLDDKAQGMKLFAREFESNATKIQSITFWHKWKLILMIAALILGVLSAIAITILIKT